MTRVVTFRSLFLAIGLLFIGLVSFQIHGFSLSEWASLTGRPDRAEIIGGQSRAVRSDDWFVHVPLFLAQVAHSPSWPAVNSLIGPEGQSMSFGYAAATREWSLWLRPQLWGFLLGPDTGLSWLWYARTLGLFCAATLFFGLLSRGDVWLSSCAALVLLFSPFYQYWSLNTEPITAFALLAIWLAFRLSRALGDEGSSWGARTAWATALVYALCAFAVAAIYPPQQVVLATFAAWAFLGLLWRETPPQSWPKWRFAGALVAVLTTVGGILFVFGREHADVIAKIVRTVYPGQRVSVGSPEFHPELLFRQNLLAFFGGGDFSRFGNISEAGSFVFLAPFVLLGCVLQKPRDLWRDPRLLCLGIFLGWVVLWLLLPFPAFFAKATGWSLVPWQRAVIGLGVGGVSLMVRLADRPPASRRIAGVVFACALLAHLWLFQALRPFWKHGHWMSELLIAVVVAVLCALPRPRVVFGLWALLSVASTWWFNPIVRGGAASLAESPLGRQMIERSQAFRERTGREAMWVVYDSVMLTNLPRALGLHSLGGTHFVPQFSLWKIYDPEGRHGEVYNRYAHVMFADPVAGHEILESPSADIVVVRDEKFSARQRQFGVTHVLTWTDTTGAAIREIDAP